MPVEGFVAFLLGMLLFVLGIAVVIFYTPFTYDLIGVLMSILGLITGFYSLNISASRDDVYRLDKRLEVIEKRLGSIEGLLRQVVEELRRR